jgi:stearoyl-CoA desaturase (delta-9 desaturase)
MPSGENQFVHYTRGMASDYKLDTFLNKMPPLSGLVLGLCLYSWLFGWPGFVIWILQTLWMPVVAGGVINVLGHTVGHVDYPCDDSSRSLAPQKKGIFSWIQVVLLNWGTGGEHLHNPHHAHAGSARFGSGKGLNFDIGYWWLVQLNKIGLVVKMNVHEEKRLI